MPWNTATAMSLRQEFVQLAGHESANKRAVCERFGISRTTGYKWLERYGEEGKEGLGNRSRRPHHCPNQTKAEVTARIVALRQEHPAWGARKLRRRLADLGVQELPAPSTITEILRREGLLHRTPAETPGPWQRFARSRPNALWQMDFKGHFALSRGGRCHPLTVLDDHARYLLGLRACGDELGATVRDHLWSLFRSYGLPEELLCDNGPPWGGPGGDWTALGVWLVRLGVRVCHGRPFHPQTQGKDERLHRTLKVEVLDRTDLRDLVHSQEVFDWWRPIYNDERPHEAHDLATPASRYAPSTRSLPASLLPIEYSPGDVVRRVKGKGEITWRNRTYYLGLAFAREDIALRPTSTDGLFQVFFCHQALGAIDFRTPPAPSKNHYLPLLPLPPSSFPSFDHQRP
jgi:transposase InsO family protein